MNINIEGTYKFIQNGNVLFEGCNLITFYGLVYFLNRCINDDFVPLKYIALGNGDVAPSKNDTILGNELVRDICSSEVDIENNRIVLHSSFEAKDLVGVTEIGVFNDKFLISHDTFTEISMDMLTNPVGSIEVEYCYNFSIANIRNGWRQSGKSIYWIYEPNTVLGVYEENTGNGYYKIDNQDIIEQNKGSYFYDSNTKNLYIHIRNEEVTINDIVIRTK